LNDVLEHDLVEGQVGDEAFELRVFVAELLQLAGFTRGHPAIDLLPAVVGLLGDPHLATDITDRDAARGLLQDRGDLLDGKRFFFTASPWLNGPDYAAVLTLPMVRKSRSPSQLALFSSNNWSEKTPPVTVATGVSERVKVAKR
jgi:hypothetical protein